DPEIQITPIQSPQFNHPNSITPIRSPMTSIDALCWWLEHTALSQTIQSVDWIVPAIQTIHILAITVVAASALMIDLRLIGVFSADRPLREVSARFLPLVWWPLLVLLATGAIMI